MTDPTDTRLRAAAPLANLPRAVQDRIIAGAHRRHVAAGETVFLQGEAARALFIVVEGCVKLYRISPAGAEAVVAILKPGRSFGEAVALKGLPYPVSAEAITECDLVTIDGSRLRQQMIDDPELAVALLAGAYLHLQGLVAQVEQLKARTGVQRVADFLLGLAPQTEGACAVTLPYNKALIAGALGMKPESLSRAFARLRDHGVTIEASTARIDDLAALRDLTVEDPGKAWMKG